MSDYVIYTDSACDISKQYLLEQWGIYSSSLTFQFDDDGMEHKNEDMPVKEFYGRMRAGNVAKTSGVNVDVFLTGFEELLKKGFDILYLGFSSALSTTCNSAEIAARELREKYRERKIVIVDTYCASVGQGLLLYLTAEQKKAGATIKEAVAFAEGLRLNIQHLLTVDDLVYLKRGGRISSTAAFVGSTLSLKPIISVDKEGKLVNDKKVRGRKKSIFTLVDMYARQAKQVENGTVFLAHSDCLEEAQEVVRLLKERYGVEVLLLTDIGTVVGSHTGPGALLLSFVANGR